HKEWGSARIAGRVAESERTWYFRQAGSRGRGLAADERRSTPMESTMCYRRRSALIGGFNGFVVALHSRHSTRPRSRPVVQEVGGMHAGRPAAEVRLQRFPLLCRAPPA